jgi:hypothetical protein
MAFMVTALRQTLILWELKTMTNLNLHLGRVGFQAPRSYHLLPPKTENSPIKKYLEPDEPVSGACSVTAILGWKVAQILGVSLQEQVMDGCQSYLKRLHPSIVVIC